jgi:putative (di)nucleoside polyphosphate hydrolase
MPQGGIDEGEDPRTAALRELREETAMRTVAIVGEMADWQRYDLPPHLLGKAWGGRYRGQTQKWFAVRFTGPESEIDITPEETHNIEFDRWKWAPVEGLLDGFERIAQQRLHLPPIGLASVLKLALPEVTSGGLW